MTYKTAFIVEFETVIERGRFTLKKLRYPRISMNIEALRRALNQMKVERVVDQDVDLEHFDLQWFILSGIVEELAITVGAPDRNVAYTIFNHQADLAGRDGGWIEFNSFLERNKIVDL